jgi:hypothetical protein
MRLDKASKLPRRKPFLYIALACIGSRAECGCSRNSAYCVCSNTEECQCSAHLMGLTLVNDT